MDRVRRHSMSASRPSVARYTGIESLQGLVSAIGASLESPAQFVGFWTAVFTPFVLLALLVAGIAAQRPLLWGGLLVANAAGIVLGQDYKQ